MIPPEASAASPPATASLSDASPATASPATASLSDDGPSPLDRRLAEPVRRAGLGEMAAAWFHGVVSVRCAGAGGLAEDPALPGRIRGAWGERLTQGASPEALAGRPCPWAPPCALDIFLRDRDKLTGRLQLPQPYVIAATDEGGDLMVRLTVMGFATDWIDGAAEALVAALRGGVFDGSARRTLTVSERRIDMLDGIDIPADACAAILHFHTPLALRSGETVHGSTRPLLSSLGNRVSGLARWQDTLVEADWPALKDAAAALEHDESALRPVVWNRRSARQGGRAIPMRGLGGTLVLRGALAPFLPLLALGSLTHAGSHAAQGMGKYTLELVQGSPATGN